MKKIGLLGGMSWESTILYYEIINEEVKKALGGLYSARIAMESFNFDEVVCYQKSGDWEASVNLLAGAAYNMQQGGADCVAICTNTMHCISPEIEKRIEIPLIHIVDVTADAIKAAGLSKVVLLGTKYTMSMDFYKQRLIDQGVDVVVPEEEGMDEVHRVIFDELCQGHVKPESKQLYLDIIEDLKAQGAQGVILGCTEIVLLIKQEDLDMPVFDTTEIHAKALAKWALG